MAIAMVVGVMISMNHGEGGVARPNHIPNVLRFSIDIKNSFSG